MDEETHSEKPEQLRIRKILLENLGDVSDEQKAAVARYIVERWMRANGYTYEKIAEEIGKNTSTVWRILKNKNPNPKSWGLIWRWAQEKVLPTISEAL